MCIVKGLTKMGDFNPKQNKKNQKKKKNTTTKTKQNKQINKP